MAFLGAIRELRLQDKLSRQNLETVEHRVTGDISLPEIESAGAINQEEVTW